MVTVRYHFWFITVDCAVVMLSIPITSADNVYMKSISVHVNVNTTCFFTLHRLGHPEVLDKTSVRVKQPTFVSVDCRRGRYSRVWVGGRTFDMQVHSHVAFLTVVEPVGPQTQVHLWRSFNLKATCFDAVMSLLPTSYPSLAN